MATLKQHLYRQRRAKRLRSSGTGFDLSADGSPLPAPFLLRAKQAIEEISAVLTPLVWNAGSIEFKPQRVVFTFRERLDTATMTRARFRLLNLSLLVQRHGLQRCPIIAPHYGLFHCWRFDVRVEFIGPNPETLKPET